MDSSVILEMKHIVKVYPGVRALDDASLRLFRGEIHGLVGENGAGKSTLMKILLGDQQADSGEIWYKGSQVRFHSPADALNAGISMIPQEISLIDTMDLAENIWVGRQKRFLKHGLISRELRNEATQKLFDRLGIQLKPEMSASGMTAGNKQLIALAKAVSNNAELIIMDEPTSSLSASEVELLYRIVRQLVGEGATIIFIGHKLDEIFALCDRLTVLRDGRYISEHPCSELNTDMLIEKIAGRTITNLWPTRQGCAGGTVLETKHLTSSGKFSDINLYVRRGEIIGLYGLVGAGRSETVRAIFGADKFDSGEIDIDGKEVHIRSPKEAIRNGLALVTEDRLTTGIIADQSITENVAVAYLPSITNQFKFVNEKREKEDVGRIVEALSVKCASLLQTVGSLSGGNQQKTIVAKWLLTDPKILILDEPTRGIDVGAKSEIHKLIAKLADEGMAVIMVSSELPEIEGMSDRVYVFRSGQICAEFSKEEFDTAVVVKRAFGITGEGSGADEAE